LELIKEKLAQSWSSVCLPTPFIVMEQAELWWVGWEGCRNRKTSNCLAHDPLLW
jgi:hypothetical protein